MLHYVYYPFPKSSANGPNATVLKRYCDKYSSHVANTHDEKTEDHKGAVLKYRGDSLAEVRDLDMLLISSHGGETDPTTIMSDVGARNAFLEGERLTASALAAQLASTPASLPRTHVLVKMLSCYAAGVLTLEDGEIRRTTMGPKEDTFAKLLAEALRVQGYDNVVVGGYAGPVMNATVSEPRHKRQPLGPGNTHAYTRVGVNGGSPVDAHQHIHWVNGAGVPITREQITALKRGSDAAEGKFGPATTYADKKAGLAEVFTRTR
jgi:hypothetical protein